jgi:hypothetical protein
MLCSQRWNKKKDSDLRQQEDHHERVFAEGIVMIMTWNEIMMMSVKRRRTSCRENEFIFNSTLTETREEPEFSDRE